jgi:hypothetical protein
MNETSATITVYSLLWVRRPALWRYLLRVIPELTIVHNVRLIAASV